jgi:hypothetical protein
MWSSLLRVSFSLSSLSWCLGLVGGISLTVYITGASLYLVRRILLDYPDSMATGILRQLADALPADNPNARVAIIEERLSDPPVTINRIIDMVMLSIGGKLRSEKMLTDLAVAAGLKVVGYYVKDPNPMYVMVCAKA